MPSPVVQDNHTPLHIAASRGSEMCMKALLQSKNVDFNVLTTVRGLTFGCYVSPFSLSSTPIRLLTEKKLDS